MNTESVKLVNKAITGIPLKHQVGFVMDASDVIILGMISVLTDKIQDTEVKEILSDTIETLMDEYQDE